MFCQHPACVKEIIASIAARDKVSTRLLDNLVPSLISSERLKGISLQYVAGSCGSLGVKTQILKQSHLARGASCLSQTLHRICSARVQHLVLSVSRLSATLKTLMSSKNESCPLLFSLALPVIDLQKEVNITLRTSKHLSRRENRQTEGFRLLKDKEVRVFKELVQVNVLGRMSRLPGRRSEHWDRCMSMVGFWNLINSWCHLTAQWVHGPSEWDARSGYFQKLPFQHTLPLRLGMVPWSWSWRWWKLFRADGELVLVFWQSSQNLRTKF